MFLSNSSKKLIQNTSLINILRVSGLSSTSTEAPLSENDHVNSEIYNRNPRNLERLRIAWKPRGYHLETKGREFWHKLELIRSGRHLTARIIHHSGPVVLEASTKEWCIRQHLYRTLDKAAYTNLARVLVQRCLESGLTELESPISTASPDTKIGNFAQVMEEGGVSLKEPLRYTKPHPWDAERPEKPWEVHE